MTPRPALARPAGEIHRVARRPDAWAWPEWSYAHEDGTFGNRYDDPAAEYRVLYASDDRAGALAETLARFRPDLELAAELALIQGDDDPPSLPPGVVPREWLDARAMGIARHDGAFVDAGHSDSLAHLRSALAARIVHYGFEDFDAGELRRRAPRAFTQEISRYVFTYAREEHGRPVAGLRYRSRLGDEYVNWAVFETDPPADTRSEPIEPDDADLQAVFAKFGLTWDG
jgi:RES domain